MERERTSGLSERMRAAMADQEKNIEQGVRMWAVEQVLGALVPGNRATPADIITMADKLATYVLTGTTS